MIALLVILLLLPGAILLVATMLYLAFSNEKLEKDGSHEEMVPTTKRIP